jgi:hypothetical protein
MPPLVALLIAAVVWLALVGVVCAILSASAWAVPPDPKSEDGRLMAPHKNWITTQTKPTGGACCSDADGRPVEADIRGEQWWIHVTPDHWPGVRAQWVPVPGVAIIRGSNPTGGPFAWVSVPHKFSPGNANCMYCGGQDLGVDPGAEVTVLCFSPPSLF